MPSHRGPPPSSSASSTSTSRRRVSIDSVRSQHYPGAAQDRHEASARSPVSPSPVSKSRFAGPSGQQSSSRYPTAASSSSLGARRASQRFAEAMNGSHATSHREDDLRGPGVAGGSLGLHMPSNDAQDASDDDDRTPGVNRAPFAYFSSATSSRRQSTTLRAPEASQSSRSISPNSSNEHPPTGLRPAIPFLRSLSSQSDLGHRQTTIAARRGSGVADLSLRDQVSSSHPKTAPNNYATFHSPAPPSSKRAGRLYDTVNTGILRSPRGRTRVAASKHRNEEDDPDGDGEADERTDLLDTFRRTEFPLSRAASRSMKSPLARDTFFRSVRRTASAVGLGAQVGSYDDLAASGIGAREEEREDEMEKTDAVALNGVRVWYSSWDTIDWLHDQIKESNRVRRLRSLARRSWRGWLLNAVDRSMGWILAAIIGVLTALVALSVIRAEQWLFELKSGWEGHAWSDLVLGLDESQERSFGSLSFWVDFGMYAGIALVLATLSALLTVHLTASNRFGAPGPVRYFAAGSGIPEVKTILSGFVIKGYLGLATLATKAIGLALSVASGMSLGKEGPMVHIACAIANITCRCFAKYETNEAKKREMLSAACAAGVAVAFGAPLGGTLFSWEESSTYYPAKVMWRSFFCASVAAITLRALDPYGNGKIVLLEVYYARDYHSDSIYLVALVLGIFGGVYGGLWARLNIVWTRNVRSGTWLGRHPILEVSLVSIVTTLVSYPSKWTRMGGVEWVASLFADCETPHHLCNLHAIREIAQSMIVRALLAAITFGIRVPAGVFVPSLAAGAAFGHIVGLLFDSERVAPGVFALIGAGATLAGVTRTTISLVVILIELTWDMHYVVPLSIAVLSAKTIADAIEKEGIYDLVIGLNQYPYLDSKKEPRFGHATVHDVLNSKIPNIRVDQPVTVGQLRAKRDQLIEQTGHADGCLPCLVDDDGFRVQGLLGANELQHALSQLSDASPTAVCHLSPTAPLGHSPRLHSSMFSFGEDEADPFDLLPYIDQAPLTAFLHSPLDLIQQLFTKLGARSVVVLDTRGYYVGLVTKKMWIKFLSELEEP